MATYLERARTIIVEQGESVARAAETRSKLPLRLNGAQCDNLWRVIRTIDGYISSIHRSNPFHTRRFPEIYMEFCLLVSRSNAIIQHYDSVQSWMLGVVLQANHRLAFKELNLDLQACAKWFHETTGHAISNEDTETIWRQEEDMEHDFRADSRDLLQSLEDLIELQKPKHGSTKRNERQLANYLLERANTNLDRRRASLPAFYQAVKIKYPGSVFDNQIIEHTHKVEWLGLACAKKWLRGERSKRYPDRHPPNCDSEIRVLANLHNPHIVKLFCSRILDSEISFLMEDMPMTLLSFIGNRRGPSSNGRQDWNPFSPLAAIDMMLQMARGMEYFHGRGYAHCDLKIRNILVASSDIEDLSNQGFVVLKIANFGLARDLNSNSQMVLPGASTSTPSLAPEAHVHGRDTESSAVELKKADIYSFAVASSEILTGYTTPLHGLLHYQGERRPPALPKSGYPERLTSLIRSCLASSPEDRPTSTQIIASLTSIKAECICSRRLLPWKCGRSFTITAAILFGIISIASIITYAISHQKLNRPLPIASAFPGR